MMQFSKPRARPKADSIVPMINVVFLLLIFFMMTARITQPAPFDVTPPKAQSEQEPQDAATLYVAADGQLGLDGQSGDTVWDALALLPDGAPLTLRADAALPARDLSRILARLADAGITAVDLVVARP
tara:strand:+ start:53882 stop:54265 length:384 start_codon:yes stop_codon:yes gene_type:complete